MEIFFGIMVIGILVWFVSIYNKLVSLRERATNAQKDISVQLDRRGKLFDSLISAVKKAMDYESTALKDIISLRTKAAEISGDAMSSSDKRELENQMSSAVSSGAFASAFNLTVEAYPELKANDNMMHLQETILSTENKLSYAKQGYNASLEKYKAACESIPDLFVVKMVPSLSKEFSYWELSEENVKTEETRRVSF